MTVHVGDHELVLDPYNYDFHEDLTPEKVDVLFKMYRDGQGKDVK